MALENAVYFIKKLATDKDLFAQLKDKDQDAVFGKAKELGFEFTPDELSEVVGGIGFAGIGGRLEKFGGVPEKKIRPNLPALEEMPVTDRPVTLPNELTLEDMTIISGGNSAAEMQIMLKDNPELQQMLLIIAKR